MYTQTPSVESNGEATRRVFMPLLSSSILTHTLCMPFLHRVFYSLLYTHSFVIPIPTLMLLCHGPQNNQEERKGGRHARQRPFSKIRTASQHLLPLPRLSQYINHNPVTSNIIDSHSFRVRKKGWNKGEHDSKRKD